MTERKNFTGQTTPSIIDTAYKDCNFSQPAPVVRGDGKRRGVRLFPGDDNPRTFTDCNLCNAEPPPGSTVVGGNTVIKEFGRAMGDDGVVYVGGPTFTANKASDFVYGRYDADTETYDDRDTAEEQKRA